MTKKQSTRPKLPDAPTGAPEDLRPSSPHITIVKPPSASKTNNLNRELYLAQYFLKMADVMMVYINPSGIVEMVNQKTCEILEYPETDILGKNWFHHFLPPRIKESVWKVFENLIQGRMDGLEYHENEILTRSGAERLIAWRNTYLSPVSSPIAGCLAVGEDITQRRAAESALKNQENQYRQLVENTNMGVMIAQNWVFSYVNPKTTEILGYNESELLGKPFLDLLHEEDREIVSKRHLTRLQGDTANERYRVRIITPKGQLRWLELKPMRVEWEKSPAVMVFLTDITGQVKAETERQKLEAFLFHSQKMEALGTMAGGFAHDFNNILGAILGFTEIALSDLPPDSPVRENILQALSASRRARNLVNQLLDFSRKSEPDRIAIRLDELIRDAVTMLRNVIPPEIRIEMDFTPSLCPVLGEPSRLIQAIMNLSSNAMRAMKTKEDAAGGLLRFSLRQRFVDVEEAKTLDILPGDCLVMTVSDTGCGMDEKTMQRIFEPYFTTLLPGEGGGLGLAVTHSILRIHKGAITVDSQPGQGAAFHLFLPAAPSDPLEPNP